MTPRTLDRIAQGFTAAVVVSVGVALAGVTWRLLGDPGTRFDAVPVAARPQPPVDLAPLVAWAPFGSAAATGAPPASSQPLVLRGIWQAVPASASSAIIAVGDQPPQAFVVGQQVGAATIDAIGRDQVVLIAGGARSILSFPDAPAEPAGASPSPPPSPSLAAAAPIASAMAPPSVAAPPPPAGTAPNFGGAPASGATGPLQAMSLLNGLGTAAGGNGYTVGAQPSPAMRMAGLQPGDTVTSVNGNPVSELLRDRSLLQSAVSGGSARLEVTRGTQKLMLTVPLR